MTENEAAIHCALRGLQVADVADDANKHHTNAEKDMNARLEEMGHHTDPPCKKCNALRVAQEEAHRRYTEGPKPGTDCQCPQFWHATHGQCWGKAEAYASGSFMTGTFTPGTYVSERRFTRVEVLTALRALKTQDYSNDPDAVFERIIAAFEKME